MVAEWKIRRGPPTWATWHVHALKGQRLIGHHRREGYRARRKPRP